MKLYPSRTIPMPAVVALLVGLAPVAGMLVARAPLLAIAGFGGLIAILAITIFDNEGALRNAALAICGGIIAYPAFLPRRAAGEVSAAAGGGLGSRALVQMVIIVGIAAVVMWLWLSTPGSIAAFLRSPLRLLGIYSALILLSLSYTPDIAWATFAAIKLFEAVLVLAVLSVLVKTRQQLKQLINVMLAAMAVIVVAYCLDIATGRAVVSSDGRYYVSWIHPNGASITAFTFTCIMAARFFTTTSTKTAYLAGFLTCLGAFSGLLIGGKSAFFGGLAALAIIIGISMKKQRITTMTGRLLLVALGIACIGFYTVTHSVGIVGHFQTYEENANLQSSNLTGRVPVWTVAIREGMTRPFLGHGYMSTFEFGLDNGLGWVATQAHNAFIQTFFDLGFAGLMIVILIYAGVWRTALRQVFANKRRDMAWRLSIELFAPLILLSINSLSEDTFGGIFETRTMLFLLVIFAIYQNARVPEASTGQASVSSMARHPTMRTNGAPR